MKKELISADNLDEFVCKQGPKVYVDPSAYILSPGAKDELARRHVEVVYAPCPDYSACGHKEHAAPAGAACGKMSPELENFVFGVAAVLKKEYGVNDPEKLREMTLQVVKTLKASL